MNNQKSNNKKQGEASNKNTYVFLGIALGTLSLAGLGYWYFKGRKQNDGENNESYSVNQEVEQSETTATPSYIPAPNISNPVNSFPIKFGSKGDLVKQIQNELLKKYGKAILPKYGADGYYGKELESALISKGFPKTIDLAEFNKILAINTKGSEPNTTNSSELATSTKEKIDIAKNVWLFCTTKNLSKLLEQLKRIKTVEDYKGVNDLFKTIRLDGVRQTIVNGTLNSFSDDTSKQLIRQEFIRVGLKYDGDKWSLSGLYSRQLKTKVPTTIRSFSNAELTVPENTLLGVEITSFGGITTFKTINHELLTVPTNHIKYV